MDRIQIATRFEGECINAVDIGCETRSAFPPHPRNATGEFTFNLERLAPNRDYGYRARVRHPLLTTYRHKKRPHLA
jgi:hypothetical protein